MAGGCPVFSLTAAEQEVHMRLTVYAVEVPDGPSAGTLWPRVARRMKSARRLVWIRMVRLWDRGYWKNNETDE